MSIPTIEELHGDAFRTYMTEHAPDCPTCGAHALEAEAMPEVDHFGRIEPNGDRVIAALETYRCGACGARAVNRVELDRITREEQDRETENAIGRARLRQELRQQYGFLGIFKRIDRGIESEVQRQFPHREDPNLMERWRGRRV